MTNSPRLLVCVSKFRVVTPFLPVLFVAHQDWGEGIFIYQGLLMMMKTEKAAGLDGCVAECLKSGRHTVMEWLVRLLNTWFSALWCSLTKHLHM